MTNWLIYEPPGGAAHTLDDAARFATVREGFSKIAFLVPLVWLIWRRCWVALAIYIAVEVALGFAADALEMGSSARVVFALLPNAVIGFEAAWLRARSLERRGYRLSGSVLARSREQAEAYFFADWLNEPDAPEPRRDGGASYRPGPARVLGLFPQPGGAR